jgi:hypothetical protein
MVNLKVELFNFRKNLDMENTPSEIIQITENHYNAIDTNSEKRIIQSLTEKLSVHTYDKEVRKLVENLNADLKENELMYNLKDLYKLIEGKNQGQLYRQPLNILLDVINSEDESDRMNKILNELALCDWVPEIKTFLYNINNNPKAKQNLLNGGQVEDVVTIVEKVENGHIALIDKSWFFLSEEKIEKTLLENHIKDANKISLLRDLQTALSYSEIKENRIDFTLNENIVFGISTENPGDTFINEDKLEKEATIDDIFASPIVPLAKKAHFKLIKTVSENLDKIIDLDISKKITNIGNPYLESYVFNFGKDLYLYRIDHRQGSNLYKYESAIDLVNDVRNELQHDLTYFFEDRLDEETKKFNHLEDKVKELKISLDEIEQNKEKVQSHLSLLGESVELKEALKLIERRRKTVEKELAAVRQVQSELKEKIIS